MNSTERNFAKTFAGISLGLLLALTGASALAAGGGDAHGDDAHHSTKPVRGDAAKGQSLAAPCAACHGQDGNSVAPLYPNIAGQGYRYLVKQLEMIKSGERSAPLMVGQLDNMSEQDLKDLATYFSEQTPKVGQAKDANLVQGERIYRGGILDKQVAACTACHGPRGSGNEPAGFPSLNGHPVEYLIDQLTKYREGERATDEAQGQMMRNIAHSLNDGEIEAVSNYIVGLH